MLNVVKAAEYLGIAKSTLRRWEDEGKIQSLRTIGGHRRYEKEYLDNFKKEVMNRDKKVNN